MQDNITDEFYGLLFRPQLGIILRTILDFKIPQILASGPKTSAEMAQILGINQSRLFRAMSALETENIFNYDLETQQFSLNDISEPFKNEDYAKISKALLHPDIYRNLSQIPLWLQSDGNLLDIKFGVNFNDYLGQKSDYFKEFIEVIDLFNGFTSDKFKDAINLSNAHKVLEISGRTGDLLINLAQAYPHIEGMVYDQTLYRQHIHHNIHTNGLLDRLKVSTGNFIDSVPEGYDTVIMNCVAQQFNDVDYDHILRNIRNVLQSGNKLYIIDLVLDHNSENIRYYLTIDL